MVGSILAETDKGTLHCPMHNENCVAKSCNLYADDESGSVGCQNVMARSLGLSHADASA